ncbi:MAG: hypothetical protein WEB00_08820 [Dehalococcoidia bacterium]
MNGTLFAIGLWWLFVGAFCLAARRAAYRTFEEGFMAGLPFGRKPYTPESARLMTWLIIVGAFAGAIGFGIAAFVG